MAKLRRVLLEAEESSSQTIPVWSHESTSILYLINAINEVTFATYCSDEWKIDRETASEPERENEKVGGDGGGENGCCGCQVDTCWIWNVANCSKWHVFHVSKAQNKCLFATFNVKTMRTRTPSQKATINFDMLKVKRWDFLNVHEMFENRPTSKFGHTEITFSPNLSKMRLNWMEHGRNGRAKMEIYWTISC